MPSPRQADRYSIELTPPDLAPYRADDNGPGYVLSYDSGRSGPHVVLVAIVHGNEICGAVALDRMLRDNIRPDQGRLSFVFANIAAYQQFDPRHPEATRYVDEDLNRVWSPERLVSDKSTTELDRARELRPVIDTADLLLDLHSMQHASAPLALAGRHPKGLALAKAVGMPGVIVIDSGHAGGTRLRDYADFDDPASPKSALLVECGQHWEANSGEVARHVSYRFLARAGTVRRSHIPEDARSTMPGQRVVEVTHPITVKTDSFSFTEDFTGQECIAEPGTVIGYDGGEPVRTPYPNAILIMPSQRLVKGQTAVRIGREIDAW